jgi:hypothetical protein
VSCRRERRLSLLASSIAAPTEIVLCDATCSGVQGDRSASIDAAFTCESYGLMVIGSVLVSFLTGLHFGEDVVQGLVRALEA